ncbi:hypothetical protein ACP6JB_008912 [Aspergillus fumigatus]
MHMGNGANKKSSSTLPQRGKGEPEETEGGGRKQLQAYMCYCAQDFTVLSQCVNNED